MASVRHLVLAAGLFTLGLSACAGYEFAPFGIENPTNQAINRAYKDRDACLTAQVNGNGSDAHAAEERVIQELRQLGQEVLGRWAHEAQAQAQAQVRTQHPHASQHGKKKS